MRKTILVVSIIAVVAAAGYGYYAYTRTDPPPTVSTAKVTRGDVADTVGATGQLQAVTTVQVGTQVSGTVLQLNADFNSLVHKGQVIARLDPSLFNTQIEQARANLVRAQADLERLRVSVDDARNKLRRAEELAAKKLIAQTELEAAQVAVRSADAQLRSQQAGVTQSEASLRQAQVNLEHTVITAPIDGLVISRNVDVGQTVAASMSAPTLFVLAADLTKMQVLASLDESDVGRIRPGQVVHFRVDAYPNDEFTGSVTQVRLQPLTVQNVVTYSTVIDVPNPELKLKPGMTANVNIEIARRNNVLRVPNAALRFRPTAEVFAALGQTPPTGGGGFGARPSDTPGRGGNGGGEAPAGTESRMGQPAQPAGAAVARTSPAGDVGRQGGSADSGDGQPIGGGARRGGRGNMADRMAGLSPEERQQFMERMRARGFDPTAMGRGRAPAEETSAKPAQAKEAQAKPANAGATTIDALFGPLPATETFGQVWLLQDSKLTRLPLRLGVSDGTQTELLEGNLKEGEEVVTSVTTASQRAATNAGSTAFPGFQQGRGAPGGGTFIINTGPGGGGGGRGGR